MSINSQIYLAQYSSPLERMPPIAIFPPVTKLQTTTHSSSVPPQQHSQHSPLSAIVSSIPQILLPFLPVLAISLLFLFLLRLLLRQFRQCLFMRLQLAPCNPPSSSSSSSPAAGLNQSMAQSIVGIQNVRHHSFGNLQTNDGNEITPWTGREPCSPPPLFLLHSDMFFPATDSGPGGGRFLDPSAASFWLDHQQLVQMLGPMPPKYEDAIKLVNHHQQRPLPSRNDVQQLCIPSLIDAHQPRRLSHSGAASPPPCYEQAVANTQQILQQPCSNDIVIDEEMAANFERPNRGLESISSRQPEQPPSYVQTTMPGAINSTAIIAPINNLDASSNALQSSGFRSTSLPLTPLLDNDEEQWRPSSSCSLRQFMRDSIDGIGAASSHQNEQQIEQRKRAFGIFVPKHMGGSGRQQQHREKNGKMEE